MSFASIVLDTRFLAQVEDTARWEDRFDILVNELREDYGPCFNWWDRSTSTDVDIVFVLYPPSHHKRVVVDRVLEDYISTYAGQLAQVHVIVFGRNSKDAKVQTSDVIDVVNVQCIPLGMKADATRVLRPEELDDAVLTTLVRLFTRRQGGALRPTDEVPLAESSGVTNPSYSPRPPYERGDL